MPRRRRFVAIVSIAAAVATLFGVAPASPAQAAVVYNGAGTAPRIGIVGDSAFAGIGVVGAFAPIRQFNFVYDAIACRRTVLASCAIAGHSPPANAMSVIRQRSGQWGSVLVMATGYNDPGHNFDDAVDAIMAEAARQGIPKVMWVTLRTAPVAFVPADYRSTSTTFRDNNLILLQKAAQYGGRLQIADWVGHTASRSDWFTSDGIHFRPAGAAGAAQFLASQARRVLNGENITPTRGGVAPPGSLWTHLRRGMGGTAVADLQRILIAEGITVRGGVTGVFNDGTLYAVATFQRMHGLHPNGVVDEATARVLGMLSGPWQSVGRGATGATVTRVQNALITRGIFVRGGATGVFDVSTMYAVQTFQRRQGLRVSGVVDADTARALGLLRAPHPSAFWNPLSRGSTGLNVARSQQALMDNGVFVRGGATGVFDVYTFYAVNTFQRQARLTVSGVIDVETAFALGLFDLSNPVATWTNLALGSSGGSVTKAEQLLIHRRILVRDGIDGLFKLGDYYAVCTFQRSVGLPVTGVIDLTTAHRLGMFDPIPTSAPAAIAAPAASTAAPSTTTTSTTTSTTTTTSSSTTSMPAPSSTGAPNGSGRISGRAWSDVNADGLADPGEPIVVGVRFRVLDAGGAEVAGAVTDERGEFVVSDLAPGLVTIEAILPSGTTATLSDRLSPGLDVEASDDFDSDFSTVDVAIGTARTEPTPLGTPAATNVGLGLVPAPIGGPTTTTTTTTLETTTTPPTIPATTAGPTTSDGPSTTVSVPTSAPAPTTAASTTAPTPTVPTPTVAAPTAPPTTAPPAESTPA